MRSVSITIILYFLQGTFIYSMVKFKPLVYNNLYEYPAWGEGIGWMLALSSMVFIPGYAIYKIVITPGTLKEVSFQIYLV